jgi:hypothetical protein
VAAQRLEVHRDTADGLSAVYDGEAATRTGERRQLRDRHEQAGRAEQMRE